MTRHEWILSLFPGHGFFVEAGAHDGVGDSQTKWLEDRGWCGLCVEPSAAFAGLKANRRCWIDNRCLWRHDGKMLLFRQMTGNAIELSGLVDTFGDHWDRETRPHTEEFRRTVSLPTLLVEHGAPRVIEFLSLDTEGSEYEILQGHDWAAFIFLAVTVEHNGVASRMAELREFMARLFYIHETRWQNEVEDWFVHGSLLEGTPR